MTIKSFFANTVAEAIREARKELGDEAMLLKSRRAPEEARHLGVYEVVFGSAESPSLGEASAASPAVSAAKSVSECIWDFPADQPVPAVATASQAVKPQPFERNALYAKLVELQFEEQLAADFSMRVQARVLADDYSGSNGSVLQSTAGSGVARAIALEAARFFPQHTSLDGGAVALIGPPGSGKTSSAVRLAVAYGVAQRRRVILLAANDHRVAASGALRQYASLLGAEFHEAADVEDLGSRVQSREEGDLILIDTPGYGSREMEQAKALAEFLSQHDEIQKHLVLPATLKGEDLRSAVERFEVFGIGHLLFTKIDETKACGSVFSQASASRKPISFFTTGQQVPGDLVPASRFDLAALLQTRNAAMASAA